VQGEPVKVPVPLLPNATVPVGALAVPVEVSVTVAVQVVGEFTGKEAGVQLTAVVVVRVVTVSAKVPELVLWFVSPA
jgi:hypothetical protein